MKWTYSIKNKLTAAGVLFCLGLLVLLSDYNNRVHTREVKEMISTLYQDRIIAEEYIFKLSNSLHEIRRELSLPDSSSLERDNNINKLLVDIASTSTAYGKTKLTKTEEIKFSQFNFLIEHILNENKQNSVRRMQFAADAQSLLKELSAIQLEESKLIVEKSEQKYRISKLSSEFAFAIVIILLIFIQALVFSSKTFHITNRDINANLN